MEVDFIWRVELIERLRARVRQSAIDTLRSHDISAKTKSVVVVRRPVADPYDDTIVTEFRSKSGGLVGTAEIAENGAGALLFNRKN
jgi:hypothetical protein